MTIREQNEDAHPNQDKRSPKEQGDALHPSVDYTPKGKKLNKEAVEQLKQYRLKVRQNHPGERFENSVDVLRQAREDRTRQLEQW